MVRAAATTSLSERTPPGASGSPTRHDSSLACGLSADAQALSLVISMRLTHYSPCFIRGLGKSSLKPEDAVSDYSTLTAEEKQVLDDWVRAATLCLAWTGLSCCEYRELT
jgi:hypothetical protein